MPKRPEPESLKHHEAFDFWYWLHPRNLDKVRVEFGVSLRAVEKWAVRFEWDRRAQERDAKLKRALEEKHDAEAVRARANLVQVADATIARYAARLLKDPGQRLQHGVSAYEPTASDASRWAQLKLLLTGQATSRTEVAVDGGFIEAFKALVMGVLRRELPRACPSCRTVLDLPDRIGRALSEASARLGSEAGLPIAALSLPAADAPDVAGPTA